jgi:acetylornithine/succinyldiaminopimelate/putrescine aminotransferase/predicted amino acid dehydrogenase
MQPIGAVWRTCIPKMEDDVTVAGAVLPETALNPERAFLLRHIGFDRAIVRAEGLDLFDAGGTRYLDALAQYGALPFGHNPGFLWERLARIRDACEPSFVQPLQSPGAELLARKLLALVPHMARVTFVNSGAEACEVAIKLARARTGRRTIVTIGGGFHGKTNAALCATANPRYGAPFLLDDAHFRTVPFADTNALERALAGGDVAALIVEPVQGEGGMRVQPPGYLERAQALCKQHGALFVLDEVQTGLGRTGALFGYQQHGAIAADMLLLAKALGGGLVPLGAVLCTRDAWSEDFGFLHSSTFANSHLTTSVGAATLDALLADDAVLVRNAASRGARLHAGLERIASAYPQAVAGVHGQGLMQGLELQPWSGERSYFNAHVSHNGWAVPIVAGYLLAVEHVLTAPTFNAGQVLRIQPALTVTEAQIDRILQALERAVALIAAEDFAELLRPLLPEGAVRTGMPCPPARPHNKTHAQPVRNAVARKRRFAFLVHPTDDDSLFSILPPSARAAGAHAQEQWVQWMRSWASKMHAPAPVLYIPAVDSPTGDSVDGYLLGAPLTPLDILRLGPDAQRALIAGYLEQARQLNADMIGLGAFTSVITRAGSALAGAGLDLTTGNSLTAIASVESLMQHAQRRHAGARGHTCAVVGAAGSVGRLVALHLARRGASALQLIGNPDNPRALPALEAVAADVHALLRANGLAPIPVACTTDVARGVCEAELVVTATSAGRSFLDASAFLPGAIVCDVARPLDVQRRLAGRSDVLVFEGGLMALPGRPRFGEINVLGYPDGINLACLSETIALTLDGATGCHSIGQRIDYVEALAIYATARKHGFTPHVCEQEVAE